LGYSEHDERCRQTVRALARFGHQLQVLTSNHRLPPMGIPSEKGIFRELRLYPESLENTAFGNSYGVSYAHERFNAESLEYRIHRFKPDLVYVWNMRKLSKSLLFRMQDQGQRVVYDLHDDWLLTDSFNEDPWYRWWFQDPSIRSKLYRMLMSCVGRARRVRGMLPIREAKNLNFEGSYVASQWLREQLMAAGLSSFEELPVIYPAVDTRKLSPKTSYKKRNHFVWAGSLGEGKGADIAVDAVGILKERGISVSLDLYGKGKPSQRKDKRERIEAAGLIDRVTMRGIGPGELSELYRNYDALLYTNRRAEPFSMTLLEAMQSKLPCIVANTGGNVEVLVDEQNALFFEAGSAEALADKMVAFLQRADGGQSLAEDFIQKLHFAHSMDTFYHQIEALWSAKK
jgi:glycosyltransferase involved in cell wall biosynthesis